VIQVRANNVKVYVNKGLEFYSIYNQKVQAALTLSQLDFFFVTRVIYKRNTLKKRTKHINELKLFFKFRQSYDVDIELNIPGTTSVSKNSLDLKNPFFRYTGQTPAAQPGTQTQSPSDAYWNTLMTGKAKYISNIYQCQTHFCLSCEYISILLEGRSLPHFLFC
jgi:hypothetical protein